MSVPTANILLVDDYLPNLIALEAVLAPLKQRQVRARSGEEALRCVMDNDFAVILMDVQMDGLDGFETARLIKQGAGTRHIPILFLTATTKDAQHRIEGYSVGAVDYIFKPFEPAVLRSKVATFVELYLQREEIREKGEALRRREREALEREKENRFRRLTDSLPQCIWAMHADGEVYYRNQVWLTYSGTQAEEPINSSFLDALHPEDRPRVQLAWEEAKREARPVEQEYRLRRADGSYRWHLGRNVPEFEDGGQLMGWVASATDIHEQKGIQEEQTFIASASAVLASSLDHEATLQSVARLAVPHLADFCTVDVLEATGAARRVAVEHLDAARGAQAWQFAERSRSELAPSTAFNEVLKTGDSRIYPELTAEFLASSEADPELKALAGPLELRYGMQVALRVRGKTFGTLRFFSTRPQRSYGAQELSVAQELAARASLSVDNALLYQAAQDAVKIRDEFLSVASHELRTPLTPLILKLQNLERMAQQSTEAPLSAERIAKDLGVARRQVQRLSDLVAGLLDLSRVSSGQLALELEDVDLAEVVAEAVSLQEVQATQAGCVVQLDCERGVVGRWDRLRLMQVVTNLLSNAFKYGARNPVRIHLERDGGMARLNVRDEGIGIAPEHLVRIFRKFERAVSEQHYGGLGLGLFISCQIVEALGGTIRAQSAPGQGATFLVQLPLRGPPAPSPA